MSDSNGRWCASSGPVPPNWGKGLRPCREVHGLRYFQCEGWVYLVGPLSYGMTELVDDEDLRLIRLGFTTDLHSRIKRHAEYIRPGTDPLLAAIPGSRADEQFFHKLFADCRHKGSMYWGNECLRAAAVAALASYEGDMGEFLFGTRWVFPADWVEEQMLCVASRFKKNADCKGAATDWDATYPFEVCMETLLRQIAIYAHVNLPNPIEPREDYVSACTDREFLNQTQQAKRTPTRSPMSTLTLTHVSGHDGLS